MLSSASGAETFKPSADSEEDKNKPVSVRGQTNDHFPGCREHDLHQGHREYRLTFSDAIQERSRNKANTKISREKNKRLLPLHVKGWGGGGGVESNGGGKLAGFALKSSHSGSVFYEIYEETQF